MMFRISACETLTPFRHCQAKVDSNKEAIFRARPDPQHLCIFCLEKFGWDTQKTEDILTPILKVRVFCVPHVCVLLSVMFC